MEKYETKAFGFPVIIVNPRWVQMGKEKVLDLDLKAVSKELFPTILKKNWRLTGGEIKFVRNFLSMTQEEFADLCGLANHSSVSKWEKNPDLVTGMSSSQEFTLRTMSLTAGGYRLKNELATIFSKFKNEDNPGDPIEIPSEVA